MLFNTNICLHFYTNLEEKQINVLQKRIFALSDDLIKMEGYVVPLLFKLLEGCNHAYWACQENSGVHWYHKTSHVHFSCFMFNMAHPKYSNIVYPEFWIWKFIQKVQEMSTLRFNRLIFIEVLVTCKFALFFTNNCLLRKEEDQLRNSTYRLDTELIYLD